MPKIPLQLKKTVLAQFQLAQYINEYWRDNLWILFGTIYIYIWLIIESKFTKNFFKCLSLKDVAVINSDYFDRDHFLYRCNELKYHCNWLNSLRTISVGSIYKWILKRYIGNFFWTILKYCMWFVCIFNRLSPFTVGPQYITELWTDI